MTIYNDEIRQYITNLFAAEDEFLHSAKETAEEKGLPAINVGPEEGRFLQILVAANQTKLAVEIGTLGGYSGTWIARGMAPNGKLFSIEVNGKHAEVAREHFESAGLSGLVEVVVGNAHEMLRNIEKHGPFDFVFIDAEKSGYNDYYDWSIRNLRTGGVIAAHNAFRSGRILEPDDDEDSSIMKVFNQRVANDPSVISTIYPAGDGTLVAVKVA